MENKNHNNNEVSNTIIKQQIKSIENKNHYEENQILLHNESGKTKDFLYKKNESLISDGSLMSNGESEFKYYSLKKVLIGKSFALMLKFFAYFLFVLLKYNINYFSINDYDHEFEPGYSYFVLSFSLFIVISFYFTIYLICSCCIEFSFEKEEANFKNMICISLSWETVISHFIIGLCLFFFSFFTENNNLKSNYFVKNYILLVLFVIAL